MRKQSAFMNVVVKKFVRARQRLTPLPPDSLPLLSHRGEAVRALPAFSTSPKPTVPITCPAGEDSSHYQIWPQEDCANEPSAFPGSADFQSAVSPISNRQTLSRVLFLIVANTFPVFVFFITSLPAQAAVREIGAIGLTVGNLDQEINFFTHVLPFEK